MPNKYQTKTFREAKKNALMGLVDALDNKNVPERMHDGLTSGLISQYFDDRFLPLRPMALLTVLREIEVPHDAQNRFLTWCQLQTKTAPKIMSMSSENVRISAQGKCPLVLS